MIIAMSLRSLLRRRGRTLLAVAGIAISAALLVDMTMLASGLTHSFGELTRAQGYGLRVTPLGTLPFDSEAGIRRAADVARVITTTAGVEAVAPVLGAQVYPIVGGAVESPVFTSGIDPSAQMLYVLLSGGDPGPREVVVSAPLAEAYGLRPGSELSVAAELDVALGQPRRVEDYRVSGIGDFIYDHAGQRSAAMRLSDVQRLTGRDDEVSLFAVAVRHDWDEQEVAARIASASPGLSVYSTGELMAAMDQRLLYFRQLSTILGAIALAVAALLVSTIVTIGVRERFGELATLRAIGVASGRLRLAIIAEGAAITTVGCFLGFPMGWWMAGRLDRILLDFPGIPARVSFFVFQPVPVIAALSAIVLIGALAGVLPGTRALAAPLGHALREEAD